MNIVENVAGSIDVLAHVSISLKQERVRDNVRGGNRGRGRGSTAYTLMQIIINAREMISL
jgi:hypothetical protein